MSLVVGLGGLLGVYVVARAAVLVEPGVVDDSPASQGRVIGTMIAALIVASIVRGLWVVARRRRASPTRFLSPWIPVVAAIFLLVASLPTLGAPRSSAPIDLRNEFAIAPPYDLVFAGAVSGDELAILPAYVAMPGEVEGRQILGPDGAEGLFVIRNVGLPTAANREVIVQLLAEIDAEGWATRDVTRGGVAVLRFAIPGGSDVGLWWSVDVIKVVYGPDAATTDAMIEAILTADR